MKAECLADQIPPHSIETEQALVGTILLGYDIAKIKSILFADDFYREAHRIIFSAMTALDEDDSVKEIGLVSVCTYLQNNNQLDVIGGAAYLASLTDIISSLANVDHYIRIIKEKAVLRNIIKTSVKTATLAYKGKESSEMILAGLQRKISAIVAMAEAVDIPNNMSKGFDELLKSFVVKKTHLKCLNKVIVGLPNDVTVIMGQTSMGKTSLALGLMQQLAIKNNQHVAYFGPHVTEDEICFRILCSMCQISTKTLKRGSATKEQLSQLTQAHNTFRTTPVSIFAMPDKMSAMGINMKTRALAKKCQSTGNMGGIIIENLQDLFWPEGNLNPREELEVIFGCFKSLALDLGIPVIISSQVKREVDERENKRPRPSDARGTSHIESLARLILILYWEGYYFPDKIAKNPDEWIPAEIASYKDGPPTISQAEFNTKFLSWRDIE